MCGISGILLSYGSAGDTAGGSGGASRKIKKKTLLANNRIMQHRGPDSSGTWISSDGKIGFAQTRLSIVDLDERASQPMILDKGNLVIVFNGEIYNYLSLREELAKKYRFKTTSDTEVVVYAYKEYGVKLFDRIEGMFAFALYDKKKNQTLIARDFVGQKPLVYHVSKKGVFFASEIPVLLSQAGISRKPDMSSLGVFMTDNFSHVPQPFSAFKDIRKLKPGHYMIIKRGKIINETQYFRFRKVAQTKQNEFEFISSIAEEMKPKDVTFSSFLSGGNDSSLVCAALRKNNDKPVEAYTLRLGKSDSDFERSKQVSKILDLKQHVVDFDPKNFLDSVEMQVKIYGEPYYHLTSVYADSILEEVKKRHKVIFTGAGGDEVYYGYNNLNLLAVDNFLKSKKAMPRFMMEKIFGKKYSFLFDSDLKTVKINYYMHNFNSASGFFSERVLRNGMNTKSYFEEINSDFFKFAEIKSFIDLSYMSGLVTENSHSLTIQSDLVGMKNSVEIRCPFLERRIIERGYSLKLRQKIGLSNPREGKVILKKALLELFPRKLVYAKKVGFGVEISKTGDILAHSEKRIVSKLKKLASRPQFSREAILRLTADREVMSRNFIRVMKLYTLEIWFEEFID